MCTYAVNRHVSAVMHDYHLCVKLQGVLKKQCQQDQPANRQPNIHTTPRACTGVQAYVPNAGPVSKAVHTPAYDVLHSMQHLNMCLVKGTQTVGYPYWTMQLKARIFRSTYTLRPTRIAQQWSTGSTHTQFGRYRWHLRLHSESQIAQPCNT